MTWQTLDTETDRPPIKVWTRAEVDAILEEQWPTVGLRPEIDQRNRERNAHILHLRDQGWLLKDIAKEVGLTKGGVWNVVNSRRVA